MQDWAQGQMRQLRRDGQSDITLVKWLMTQKSRADVVEYVHMYLGASAATSAFTDEFLKWV